MQPVGLQGKKVPVMKKDLENSPNITESYYETPKITSKHFRCAKQGSQDTILIHLHNELTGEVLSLSHFPPPDEAMRVRRG